MDSPKLEDVRLFAWVGEDEFGSGVMGLKQAIVPAGCIPIVAISRTKVDQVYIRDQLEIQARRYGKPISLVEFRVERVLDTLEGK